MIYKPIWQDTYFMYSGDTLNYYIEDDSSGEVIHSGYTKRMPIYSGLTMNINNRVEEYLNPNFDNIKYAEDFLSIISDIEPESDAFKSFTIKDGATSAELVTYGFLYDWSYSEEPWSGQNGYAMSNPINGHCDPRMKELFGMANTAETSFDYELEYTPYIKVNPTVFYFPLTGGTSNVYVESKGNWSASTDENWFTIDVTSHTGSYQTDHTTVVVTASANPDRLKRSGTITFVGEDGASATVRVYQYEVVLYVVPESHYFYYQGGTINLAVYYNVDFTISSDSAWLTTSYGTIPPTDGSGKIQRTDVLVTAADNQTGFTRTGIVTFASTNDSATFTGTQGMRLDNKIIYNCSERMYLWVPSSYGLSATDVWGAEGLAWDYNSETGTGLLCLTDSVTKYNGLVNDPPAGSRPYTPHLNWVWMPSCVTRINGFPVSTGSGESYGVIVDPDNMGEMFKGCTYLTAVTVDDHYYEPTGFTLNNMVSLPNGCFYNCTAMTEFNASPYLRNIGEGAFINTSLTALTLGNVVNVGKAAFAGCTGLTSVVIPDSVTSMEYIGDGEQFSLASGLLPNIDWPVNGAFSVCESLTSITIGSGVTVLPRETFSKCISLPSITIPNNIREIGNRCFVYCNSLTSINIPGTVKKIGNGCFGDDPQGAYHPYYDSACKNLSSITLNEGIEEIGDNAFMGCTALTEVTLPSTLKVVNYQLFKGCTSLSSVTLNAQTEFWGQVFNGCTALTSVVIPDTTTRLGSEMFMNCTSLSSVTIGSSVTIMYWNIGGFDYGRQFVGCSSLCEIYAKPYNAPTIYDAFDGVAEVGTLHYPVGADYSSWIYALPSGWTAVADL